MLYFAYGSNLWNQQMESRCPQYKKIGTGRIDGWRWIITSRGYASIVESEADYLLGTVFELSESDLLNLDRFEGVTRGSYYKEILQVNIEGKILDCMVYIDPVVEEGKPREEYINRINRGIVDAGLADDYVQRYLRPFVPAEALNKGFD
ncbi:MAG: gamma-glutamylcyclotransferase [Geobacteraceae bacterium]|nr:gamma-glutamylcyclotransferase [Geobacteraceae bacterium]